MDGQKRDVIKKEHKPMEEEWIVRHQIGSTQDPQYVRVTDEEQES